MKLLVLYVDDNKKDKYVNFFSEFKNISPLFLNINLARNTILFSYIRQSEKIILFFDKNDLKDLNEKHFIILELLAKYNDKVMIVSNDTLPYAVTKSFSSVYYYNIDDRNDNSHLKKQLKNVLDRKEDKILLINKSVQKNNKNVKKNKIIRFILTLDLFILFSSLSYGLFFEKGIFNNFLLYIIAWFLLIISILILIFYFSSRFASIIHKNDKEKEEYIDKATDLIVSNDFSDNKDSKDNSALGRMLLNLDALQEYYSWSKSQSKMSFYLAIALIILGILIIAIAVFIQIAFKVSITISIVISLSGAIVEFIAGTALVVYKDSLKQLNHYHRVLHEDERFLSSVNMVNDLSNDKDKDDMIKELIRSEIELNKLELSQISIDNKVNK